MAPACFCNTLVTRGVALVLGPLLRFPVKYQFRQKLGYFWDRVFPWYHIFWEYCLIVTFAGQNPSSDWIVIYLMGACGLILVSLMAAWFGKYVTWCVRKPFPQKMLSRASECPCWGIHHQCACGYTGRTYKIRLMATIFAPMCFCAGQFKDRVQSKAFGHLSEAPLNFPGDLERPFRQLRPQGTRWWFNGLKS